MLGSMVIGQAYIEGFRIKSKSISCLYSSIKSSSSPKSSSRFPQICTCRPNIKTHLFKDSCLLIYDGLTSIYTSARTSHFFISESRIELQSYVQTSQNSDYLQGSKITMKLRVQRFYKVKGSVLPQ